MNNNSFCVPKGNKHINRFKMAHMIGVAEYMRERANDYGLDPEVMYTVGLLHDIGYLGGRVGHERYGAAILSALNVDDDIRLAIAHHGDNLYKFQEEYGKDAVTPAFVLLLEADMSVDARGYRVGFDGRIADISERYGKDHIAYKTAQDNIRFIKEYQKEHSIGKPIALHYKGTTGRKGEER